MGSDGKDTVSRAEITRRRLEAMEAAQAEEARQQRRYQDMMDAIGASDPWDMTRMEAKDLGTHIKDAIDHHERMIEALEWFGAHIGIDKPNNPIVERIIRAGLSAELERIDKERLGRIASRTAQRAVNPNTTSADPGWPPMTSIPAIKFLGQP